MKGLFCGLEGDVEVVEDWDAHPFDQVGQVGVRSLQVL